VVAVLEPAVPPVRLRLEAAALPVVLRLDSAVLPVVLRLGPTVLPVVLRLGAAVPRLDSSAPPAPPMLPPPLPKLRTTGWQAAKQTRTTIATRAEGRIVTAETSLGSAARAREETLP
jgi:hypothetical protein